MKRIVTIAAVFFFAAGINNAAADQLLGKISNIANTQLIVETSDGSFIKIDASTAINNHRTVVLYAGEQINAQGDFDVDRSLFHANLILRVKPAITPK